jgi:hypothetical protein
MVVTLYICGLCHCLYDSYILVAPKFELKAATIY